MRKINAVLSMVILLLFLMHGAAGAMQMIGLSRSVFRVLAWTMTALIAIHAVIGIIMTYRTLLAMKRSSAHYWKGNQLFWARRISGFAIMIFILLHVTAFGHSAEGAYRLRRFDAFRLSAQILLVISIAVHVITNVKPMLISLGIKSLKEYVPDILVALSIMMIIMALAFVIYYLRWNVF